MAMAPSGLATTGATHVIPRGRQGSVELRSLLAGRPLLKAMPRAKTHSSQPASRLVVRAAKQVKAEELNNGFTLFSFSVNEDSDSEDQTTAQPGASKSNASGSGQDKGSQAAGVAKPGTPGADKGKPGAASDDTATAPQRRAPPKFIKLSPVPAAKQRGLKKEAEAAELRQAAAAEEAAKAPVASKFSKRSPVADWAARPGAKAAAEVPKAAVQKAVEEEKEQEKTPVTPETPETSGTVEAVVSPATPSLPARPPSSFIKASPAAAFAQSPAPVHAAEAAAPTNLSAARPPSDFQKKSPVVMARAIYGFTGRARPAGADSSRTGETTPLRLPSNFQKRSPVLDAQGRPVVIRAVSLEPRTASLKDTEASSVSTLPTLVGSPAGGAPPPASEPSSPLAAASSDSSSSATSPERQPSSFKKVRRPLPATEPQVPASQIPIQAAPNGTTIHNRLPIAQPLGLQSPALMEDWGPADSAADGLVTAQETVTVVGTVTAQETIAVGETVILEESVTVQETVTVHETVTVTEPGKVPQVEEEEVEPSSEQAAEGEGSGAGKYSVEDLNASTVAGLKELAKAAGLKGYSKLKKAELVDFLLQNS